MGVVPYGGGPVRVGYWLGWVQSRFSPVRVL